MDETYVKVNGAWCYLYRAIDRDGNLIDSMLSETRDMDAAQRFFCQAKAVTGSIPERVTTDGHTSYPRAIRETLGEEVEHRCNQYLNNRLEQDHRGIKQRYYPMRGFGTFESASRFCRAFDELRQFEWHRRVRAEMGSLAKRRQQFITGTAALQALMLAVYQAASFSMSTSKLGGKELRVPNSDTAETTRAAADKLDALFPAPTDHSSADATN